MPRMEKLRNLFGLRINSRQIWTLVQVAIDACQGQVIEVIRAAMSFGDNMFHMKHSQRRIVLVQVAVFTTITGTLPNA